ncbi:Retrovirus-related Pol polyprotein LINE-1 [Gossypium australe]|uniref:Retrovirus-related Pol polyprotein LINE-1 n=1 Tax=Gossypium australe TaxID=47621 RepID=A0A5B6VYK7_9ROSI|nr:Retrovirus-related Pol polyprotein LINE-1 [Gossypium australe]
MAIKVDLEKACDQIRWDFIKYTILDAGISLFFSNVIMECVSTVSTQILWNGIPSDIFFPMRCIRQGCSLSPYLFVLSMERLGLLIHKETNVDRVFIICDVLSLFGAASGHKVNGTKTNIFFSKNINANISTEICNILGFSMTDNLGSYLGENWIAGTPSCYKWLVELLWQGQFIINTQLFHAIYEDPYFYRKRD